METTELTATLQFGALNSSHVGCKVTISDEEAGRNKEIEIKEDGRDEIAEMRRLMMKMCKGMTIGDYSDTLESKISSIMRPEITILKKMLNTDFEPCLSIPINEIRAINNPTCAKLVDQALLAAKIFNYSKPVESIHMKLNDSILVNVNLK